MEKLTKKIESEELNEHEALELAQAAGKTICNAVEVDAEAIKTGHAFWCGPFIAHAKKGKTLGETAKREDLTTVIPKKFQGLSSEKGISSECDNLIYDAETKTVSFKDESKVSIIDVPKDGLYAPNKQGVPVLPKTGEETDRRFWRSESEYVGLLVRGDYYVGYRDVDASYDPDVRFRVLVK